MLTTVLFDLDGTLLPMDQDEFVAGYFGLLAKKAAPYGYEAKRLINTVWAGTSAMVRNDGSRTNEEAFWRRFAEEYGEERLRDKAIFDEFYANEFAGARSFCGFNPEAAELVRACRRDGLHVLLATNPIFPAVATETRIRWAGLEPDDFELVTTYESDRFCKPNPDYYRDILRRTGVPAAECLMVGNDVSEDMAASALGMEVFLLTDCLINKNQKDISVYPNGGFTRLAAHIRRLRGA